MINIGVIGCGKIAQVRHLPEYAVNPKCRIAAVFDINSERCREIAEQYQAVACASVEELLSIKEIDAVSVCTANTTHAQITIDALNAGRHVLCEKPMAMTYEDCERMVSLAKEKGLLLMIDHNQRLAKAHVAAKEMLERGEIGRILRFKTEFSHCGPETWSVDPGSDVWFFDKSRAAMGAMGDLGIHKTDLIHFLTGSHVKAVTACISTLDKRDGSGHFIGVDDNAICVYELENGSIGTMTASWSNYGAECNSTVLYGTEGVMHIYEDPEHTIVVEYRSGEKKYFDVERIQTNDNQTKSGVIDLWIEAIESGSLSGMTGEESLYAMKAVFAAFTSSEKGERVSL